MPQSVAPPPSPITRSDEESLTTSILPIDKTVDLSKIKAFAKDNLNTAQKMQSVCERIENIVEKREKMLVTCIFSFQKRTSIFSFSHSVS